MEQARAHVTAKTENPAVHGIEKDSQALREAIRSGGVVELTEDTFVTLCTPPGDWLDENHRQDWRRDITRLGYAETLCVLRYPADPRQGVPPLFGGTLSPVNGNERYVAARYFDRRDGAVALWAEGRIWKEPSGKPGAVTCDFFLQAKPLEPCEWVERTLQTEYGPHSVLAPVSVADELN